MPDQSSIEPVFLRLKDYLDNLPAGNQQPLNAYDVCMAAEKQCGPRTIDGAQLIRGVWRIYPLSKPTRVNLLVENNLQIRGLLISLHDKNPSIGNVSRKPGSSSVSEKVILRELPMSVSNEEIEKYLTTNGVSLRTSVRYCQERDPNGKLTSFKNGDRYVYAESPINPALPRNVVIAEIRCKIFHNGQFQKGCRACNQLGHKAGEAVCSALNTERDITVFAGHFHSMSNFYTHELLAFDQKFHSVEQAWQWRRAFNASEHNLAKKIMNTKHAGEVRQLVKNHEGITADPNEDMQIMEYLIGMKAKQCEDFTHCLIESQKYIAEASTDKFWASGLNLQDTISTKPEYWPGSNKIGTLLEQLRDKVIREEAQVPSKDDNPIQDNTDVSPDTTQDTACQSGQIADPETSQVSERASRPRKRDEQPPMRTHSKSKARNVKDNSARCHSQGCSPTTRNFSMADWCTPSNKRKTLAGTPPAESECKLARGSNDDG